MPFSDWFTYSTKFVRSLVLYNDGNSLWRVLFYAPLAVFVFTEIVEYRKVKKHYYAYLIVLQIYSILDFFRFSLVIFSNVSFTFLSSISILLFKGAIVFAVWKLLKSPKNTYNNNFQINNSSYY